MNISANRETRTTLLLVSLFTVAAAFARLYGLGAWDYYHDEIWHVYIAGQPTLRDVFYADLKEDGHPLLPYFLWHFLLKIWDDPWMARLPSLIAGIACVPMGYLFGKTVFGTRNGGLFAAFFMAFTGLMVIQSQVTRGYAMMVFFAMVAMWASFRYRESLQSRHLAIYFFSMFTALLCEFAAAPVAVYTALHIAYSIYTRSPKRITMLGVLGLMQMAMLAYLVWFAYLLRTVGKTDFGKALGFLKVDENSWLENSAQLVMFFVDFINQTNIFSLSTFAYAPPVLLIIAFLIFLFGMLFGVAGLIHFRKWWLLFYVALSMVLTIAFYHLRIIPVDYMRRHITLIFAVLILAYYGILYFGLAKRRFTNISPIQAMVTATTILSLCYLAYGLEWRIMQPLEFQQTRAHKNMMFEFLEKHAKTNDVIVTDWGSYHHFWKDIKQCPLVPITDHMARYDCYRIPVFVYTYDARIALYRINIAQFQEGLQDLDKAGVIKHARHIWMVSIQHADSKTTVLSNNFEMRLRAKLTQDQRERYRDEVKQLVSDQETFVRWAYEAASPKRVTYAFPCGVEEDKVEIGTKEHCLMNLVLLSLPKSELDKRIIRHAPFSSVESFLHDIYGWKN